MINLYLLDQILGLSPNGPYVASYQGIMVQQRPNAVPFLIDFINHNQIEQVVEIGTGYGGLTRALLDYTSARVVSVDIEDKSAELKFYSPRILRLIGDCQSNEITSIVGDLSKDVPAGRSLFLIDGGLKMQEFNHYSELLKAGDFIFVHDFAPSSDEFEHLKTNNIWLWHEADESQLELTSLRRLADFTSNWKNYLWGTYQKLPY